MSEPVIEVIRPCEHGEFDKHTTCEAKPCTLLTHPICPGGSRVRYTRQEAIDRIGEFAVAKGFASLCALCPEDSIDALLGETDV